jgi:hypothetical protein
LNGPEELDPELLERLRAAGQRRARHLSRVVREHHRPANPGFRNGGGDRHGIDHQTGLGSLPEFAEDQASEKRLLGFCGTPKEVAKEPDALTRRARTARLRYPLEGVVHIPEGERRGRRRGPGVGLSQHGRSDPGPALGELARQVLHSDPNLVRVHIPKGLRQSVDLGFSASRVG